MKAGQYVCRRRAAVLVLIFVVVICALAKEGVLVLLLTDIGNHPFPGVRISATGETGPPQAADQNGKVRLELAPGTQPSSWVKLVIANAPHGNEVAFVSPPDGRVRVPSFDNEQDNYDSVVIVRRGDKAMLESGPGMLAIHAAVNAAAAAQRKRPTSPSSEDHRRPPSPVAILSPHLQNVLWRESTTAPNYDNSLPADDAIQQAALAAAAEQFGLSIQDVKESIAVWGGDALLWGELMLTASIEAGGTDPFSYVRAANQDIQFGSGIWGLQDCRLQDVLLQFQHRDQRRFAEIVGADTEWLSKTMTAPCEASAKSAVRRMLDDSGHLSALWKSRFRNLGNEHSFQHVQVEQLGLEMIQAQGQASALGLQSEQAVAFLAAPAIRRLVSATPAFREGCLQGIASFTRQNGRVPGEREKLLILKDHIIQSWNEQPKISPQATADFVSLVDLFFDGSGTVSGRHYVLDDFGMGMISTRTVGEVKPSASGPVLWSACSYDVFDPAAEKQLVDLMNQERSTQGIPPLQVDARLTQAARKHTELVVRNHSLAHQIADEVPMAERFSNEHLPSDQQAENISVAADAPANHESMMHSPYHRANILNPTYNVVGVGAVQCGALWVTQDFAHHLPEYSESQADSSLQQAIEQYAHEHGMPPPARKPQEQLRNMACEMAKNGAVNREEPGQLPGVNGVVVWKTGDPAVLPPQAEARLSQLTPAGYSMGACLAPSVGHSEGTFWVVLVTY